MTQSSIKVSTTPPLPGLQLVNQVNDAIQTVATDFAGDTDPAGDADAMMVWADTLSGNLKRRNAANSAWDVIGRVSNRHIPEYSAAPSTDQGGVIYVTDVGLMQWDGAKYVPGIGGSKQATRFTKLFVKNNAANSGIKLDISADSATIRNPSTGGIVTFTGVAVTNDITVSAAANGRDQAGAFTANQFIHFYLISDGTSVASLSSTAAPSAGPILPSGYTHWAYVTTVYLTTGIQGVTQTGSWVHYDAGRFSVQGGASTTEVAVSPTTAIPSVATQFKLHVRRIACTSNPTGGFDVTCAIGYVSGQIVSTTRIGGGAGASSIMVGSGAEFTLPNISQRYYYSLTITAGSGPATDHAITAYQVPNGAD